MVSQRHGLVRRLTHLAAFHLWARHIIRRRSESSLLGFRLTVEPGVFHPRLFFSSRIVGELLGTLDLAGKDVLDLGTGSGILAICAARRGAHVTAVDIDAGAVRCARHNVEANGYADTVEVVQSDLFSTLTGRIFDLVIWNPPYYEGDAQTPAQRAWYGGRDYSVIRRFAAEAPRFLRADGTLLIILSSDVDVEKFFSGFAGFTRRPLVSERRWFETLTVYELMVASPETK